MNDKRQAVRGSAHHRVLATGTRHPAQSRHDDIAHLAPGDPIAYRPPAAGEDWDHPEVQQGWILSLEDDTALCKFYYPGTRILKTLRPVAIPLASLRPRVGWKVT